MGEVPVNAADIDGPAGSAARLRPGGLPRWAHRVLDGVIIAALAGSTFIPFNGAFHLSQAPLTVLLFLLAGCALVLRARWPLSVLAACLAVFGIAAASSVFVTPLFVIPVAMAMFTVAARASRRRTIIVGSATVIVLALLLQFVVLVPVTDPRSLIFVLVVVVSAALGDGSRSRHEYLAAMVDRAVTAEATRESEARRRIAEDRLRIARDLHDAVAHQIAVINLHAGVASAALQSRPEESEASLAIIRAAARTTLTEIGTLLARLRDGGAERGERPHPGIGLGGLEELIRTFELSGLSVDRRGTGPDRPLSAETDVVAFRVIQEGLTNAQKHGTSGSARLELEGAGREFTITIENPAGPFEPSGRSGTGNGLLGIAERVESVGGRMHAGDTGHGTYRLTARLPIPASQHSEAQAPTQERGRRETV